ncbi:hypothetical protein C7M61_001620 [Candidozyma pseudohaemuli]|uniref:Uncharacterized protein n=1 Tax=Candidozyma pseudohaemuli TaxID=418784 RepID=A0A2P7YV21_9ASCO|nr:hypothetical protein C7M61_001620 [[Candida] pseudohaemulonii]PSK39812.1 hypothetical protein C7M61_001620 [[Candida] pseudohaemulonii]
MASESASREANDAQSDPLTMFFDDNFNPTSYVDALFHSITGSDNKFSKQLLARLSSTLLDVITHLDYQTNEISRDLALKFDNLKTLSLNLAPAIETESTDDNTRLQYYVSALHNTVDTLQEELTDANEKLKKDSGEQLVAVESLILLKQVKRNIQQVLKVLQSARDMLGHDPSQVSIDQFQTLLNLLFESLKNQLRSKSQKELDATLTSIEELRKLATVFHQFSAFGPAYSRFIAKLDSETQRK